MLILGSGSLRLPATGRKNSQDSIAVCTFSQQKRRRQDTKALVRGAEQGRTALVKSPGSKSIPRGGRIGLSLGEGQHVCRWVEVFQGAADNQRAQRRKGYSPAIGACVGCVFQERVPSIAVHVKGKGEG